MKDITTFTLFSNYNVQVDLSNVDMTLGYIS